jgi:hypothetical protein
MISWERTQQRQRSANERIGKSGPAETIPSEVFTTGPPFFGILSIRHGKKSWLSPRHGDIIVGPWNPWPAPDGAPLFSLVNRPSPSDSKSPSRPEAGRPRVVFGPLDLVAP